jgi:hypothetical protein
LVKVKLSSESPFTLNVMGLELVKGSEPVTFPTLVGALVRNSHPSLDFIYEESDREEMMQLDTEMFEVLSRELGTDITTHEELCALLLPKKTRKSKAKKETVPVVEKAEESE